MVRRAFCVLVGSIVALGCSRPSKSSSSTSTGSSETTTTVTASDSASAAPAFAGKKFRDGRGTVKGFGDGRKSIKILHDDIPDFAKSTTTTFPVMAPYVIEGIAEGDRVEFTFSEEFDKALGGILLHKIAKR